MSARFANTNKSKTIGITAARVFLTFAAVLFYNRQNSGGQFVIVNEDDGLSGNNEKWEKLIEGMHTYKPEEIRLHLSNAGFKGINIQKNEAKHWLMATAAK